MGLGRSSTPYHRTQMKITAYATCSGGGYWSHQPGRVVKITNIEFRIQSKELRVFFDASTWNISTDGLIYTDKGWLNDLIKILKNAGFNHKAFDKFSYSEQGMQGKDYVSLDAYGSFGEEWSKHEHKES